MLLGNPFKKKKILTKHKFMCVSAAHTQPRGCVRCSPSVATSQPEVNVASPSERRRNTIFPRRNKKMDETRVGVKAGGEMGGMRHVSEGRSEALECGDWRRCGRWGFLI